MMCRARRRSFVRDGVVGRDFRRAQATDLSVFPHDHRLAEQLVATQRILDGTAEGLVDWRTFVEELGY